MSLSPAQANIRSQLINTSMDTLLEFIEARQSYTEHFNGKKFKPLESGLFSAEQYLTALKSSKCNDKLLTYHENFSSEKNGYAPSSHWAIEMDSEKKILPYHYRIDTGTPSDALDAFVNGPSFIKDGQVLILCHLIALRELLGIAKFNILFLRSGTTPLRVVYDNLDYGSMSHLLKWTVNPQSYNRGDIVIFKKEDIESPFFATNPDTFINFSTKINGVSFVALEKMGYKPLNYTLSPNMDRIGVLDLLKLREWSAEKFSEWMED